MIGDRGAAPSRVLPQMSPSGTPGGAVGQGEGQIAEVTGDHPRSLHPPGHERVYDVLHVVGTHSRLLPQLGHGALREARVELHPREPLLCHRRPFAVHVETGGCVLVQRGDAQDGAGTRLHSSSTRCVSRPSVRGFASIIVRSLVSLLPDGSRPQWDATKSRPFHRSV